MRLFTACKLYRGLSDPPPLHTVVRHLIELELREKNERDALYEERIMMPHFKVFGQTVTSEVRSNTHTRAILVE